MKKFFVLFLLMFLSLPVFAGTCRNGKMTVYHHHNYGYYQNNNVYPNYNNSEQKKPKPVYTYTAVGAKPPVYSSKPAGNLGYLPR